MLLDTKKIIDRIRMLQAGESENAMAKRLGISQSVLNYTLNGKRKVSLSLVYAICHNYGVTSDWLLGLSESQNTPQVNEISNTRELAHELDELKRRVARLEIPVSSSTRSVG